MGRIRKDGTTKVWHNPDISGRRGERGTAPRPAPSLEERRTTSAHRAALEALFAPKKDDDGGKVAKALETATGKPAGRIVLAPPPQADPRAHDRQRLLGKLLAAEGRPAITKAANELAKHGFTLPQEQDVYLQLLEHSNEERVQEAIAALARILLSELPKRRPVLESRLRRIEEYAEDEATRSTAAELRRQVTGRGVASSAKLAGRAPTPVPATAVPEARTEGGPAAAAEAPGSVSNGGGIPDTSDRHSANGDTSDGHAGNSDTSNSHSANGGTSSGHTGSDDGLGSLAASAAEGEPPGAVAASAAEGEPPGAEEVA